MRKLIAWAFMCSLNGFLTDEGTEYWQFCFGLPVDPVEQGEKLGVFSGAHERLLGRAAYEAMAGACRPPTTPGPEPEGCLAAFRMATLPV
jgi:hypothetical protein